MREIDILRRVKLFEGIEEGDFEKLLSCLDARKLELSKDSFVLLMGEPVQSIGIILSGTANIIRENDEGERIIITALQAGNFFGEALCCAEVEESPVSVLTSSDSKIMLLDFKRILGVCPTGCSFHSRLIKNMLRIIADKNLLLQNRLDVVSRKSLRAKILAYFELQANRSGREFTIPFNREELADHLCADRSALSHELARMKRDGILDYRKNHFHLK